MSEFSKKIISKRLFKFIPIFLLLFSVLNEIDFNYLKFSYFSFNFPFILIYYWSLKKSGILGYGLIFISGLINDVVTGFPLGISSLSYLLICGFAAYLRNITLRPNLIKDWIFFLFTISVINSFIYVLLILFFSYEINYNHLIVNVIFTFLFYFPFAYIFHIYQKIVFGDYYD